jgi:hypothetical protein
MLSYSAKLSKPTQAKVWGDLIWKTKLKQKRAGGVIQMVEYLPSQHKVLSLNTSAAKINKSQ